MQNKKSLLQRLLVIYITFFIVLVASIAHGILPNFTRGAAEGAEMGNDIAENTFTLLDNLLKWTKCQIGRMNTVFQDADLAEVVLFSSKIFEADAKAKGISIEHDVQGPIPTWIWSKPSCATC